MFNTSNYEGTNGEGKHRAKTSLGGLWPSTLSLEENSEWLQCQLLLISYDCTLWFMQVHALK